MKRIATLIIALIVTIGVVKLKAQVQDEHEDFYRHLGSRMKYPKTATASNTQGYSLITFKILKSNVNNVSIATSLGDECDIEVVTQVLSYKGFSNFKDGNYALKVKFSLPDLTNAVVKNEDVQVPKGFKALKELVIIGYKKNEDKAKNTANFDKFIRIRGEDSFDAEKKPLVILDSNIISYEDMKTIDQSSIESINIIKDAQAAQYGPKGVNGVILITTKKLSNKPGNLENKSGQKGNVQEREWKGGFLGIQIKPLEDKQPLIILDSNEIAYSKAHTIDPDQIAKIEIYKEGSKVMKYGSKAADGVIFITSKRDLESVKIIGYGNKVSSGTEIRTTLFGMSMKTDGTKKEPLYMLDGEVMGSQEINTMDPNRIESVTVLKDASSRALYGPSAENGVILITTKVAKEKSKK